MAVVERMGDRGKRIGFWLLLGLAVGSLAAFQALRLLNVRAYREELTLSTSTAFVVLALWCGGPRHGFGRLMTAGLIACWFGDMLGPGNFVLGACCFLVAHLCFIPAFLMLHPAPRTLAWGAPPAFLAGLVSIIVFYPHVPATERLLFIGYTVVISAMLSTALSVADKNRLVAPAALLFYVSDIFVARWKYFGEDWNGLVCYPLYYLSCILFACSVMLYPGPTRRSG